MRLHLFIVFGYILASLASEMNDIVYYPNMSYFTRL